MILVASSVWEMLGRLYEILFFRRIDAMYLKEDAY